MLEGCVVFPYGRFELARAGDGKVGLPRGDGDDGETTTTGRSTGGIRHLDFTFRDAGCRRKKLQKIKVI